MQLGIIATVYALILVAELPDKTMIATLIMGSRYRPVLVWLGAVLAFTIHVTVAVAVGQLLHLLPHKWIEGVTTLLFAAGAVYLLVVPEKAEEEEGEHEADAAGVSGAGGAGSGPGSGGAARLSGLRTVAGVFLVVFVGEFGDLTQLLTANLAAKYHAPASVFIGAWAGLVTAAAAGAFGGRALVKVLPLVVIRKAGGVLLAGFAIYSLVQLIRG